jgi:uncharacterized membrane protein YoaK (UPF0700 family)
MPQAAVASPARRVFRSLPHSQTVSFPRVEGLSYNSVMVTSNFRQTIEGLFAALAGSTEARRFRRPYLFGAMCIVFGVGAASGAFATEATRNYSLVIPVMLLVLVLVHCELDARDAERAPTAKA